MEMSPVAQEYLRNTRKALKIAESVKFNNFVLNYQLKLAESYWNMFLKSSKHGRFHEQMNRFREFVRSNDVDGALKFVGHGNKGDGH